MARRIIIDGIRIEGAEAKRIVREVYRDAGFWRSPMLGAAVLACIAAAMTSLLMWAMAPRLGAGWLALICMAVAFVVSAAWTHVSLRRRAPQFREAMRRRGFELCPKCGYWLKGLESGGARCPECGTPRGEIE